MKVGETGEAFFVLETDEDVPEDLMTSPVVMPTEVRWEPSIATLD
jgi:phosphatidate phosphatase LPIN